MDDGEVKCKVHDVFYLWHGKCWKCLEASIGEHIKCLAFFRSVIKSGESWSDTCDQMYKAATSHTKGPVQSHTHDAIQAQIIADVEDDPVLKLLDGIRQVPVNMMTAESAAAIESAMEEMRRYPLPLSVSEDRLYEVREAIKEVVADLHKLLLKKLEEERASNQSDNLYQWVESKKHKNTWDLLNTDGNMVAYITPRPHYCDRGHYLGNIELPGLDAGDNWPNYYTQLTRAKDEIMDFVLWRVHQIRKEQR